MEPLHIPTILWGACLVNFSFMIALLMLRTDRVWDGARYWITGNIIGFFAPLLRLWLDPSSATPIHSILPATLMMVTNIFKILALARQRQRRRAALIGGALVLAHLLLAAGIGSIHGINIAIGSASCVLAFLIGWQAYICFFDARWKKLSGQPLFVWSSVLIVIFTGFAGIRGFQVQPGALIFQESGPAERNLSLIVAYVIISQICLISMLMDRLNRIVSSSQLRQRKQSRLTAQANAHSDAMSKLAREKQALLEVLVHEVRQPLNNAQSALQNVLMTLQLNSPEQAIGRRLQSIIDKIVLSLSNAIVGANMVERRTQSQLVRTDIVSVCELACSDTGLDWRDQIQLISPKDGVFADADPVLLRLAVRNLIDNAQKHSIPDQMIDVVLRLDIAQYVITIAVINSPAQPFEPLPRLFERGIRGRNAKPNGGGLGLYIARQIADIHDGSIRCTVKNDGRTEFEISIPA